MTPAGDSNTTVLDCPDCAGVGFSGWRCEDCKCLNRGSEAFCFCCGAGGDEQGGPTPCPTCAHHTTLRGVLAALGLRIGRDELDGRWGLDDRCLVDLDDVASRAVEDEIHRAANEAEREAS